MFDGELLNDYLSALESGKSPEAIITRALAADGEVGHLVQLAANIRTIEHPSLSPEVALAQQKQAMAATTGMPSAVPFLSTNGSAAKIPAAALPHPSLNGKQSYPSSGFSPAERPYKPALRRTEPAIIGRVGLALAMVLAVAGIVLGAFWWSANQQARTAVLEDVSGVVQVTQDGAWRTAITGDRVLTGQRIRTGPGSDVTLVFFEGSQTRVGPSSDVTLSTVGGTFGGTLRVRLRQLAGRTSNDIVPLRGTEGYFIVDTPSGRAVVQGTQFDVTVGDGEAVFAVNRGKVLVSSAGQEVVLRPGQATAAATGEPLEAPAYTFTLQGELSSISGNTWTIAGKDVVVRNKTTLSGDPQVGDTVLAVGRITDEGLWLADSVQVASDETTTGTFTGTLDSMDGDSWTIGGHMVDVTGADVEAGLVEGDLVTVTFKILDNGSWQAVSIEKAGDEDADDEDDEDVPEITETPTVTDTAEVAGTPEADDLLDAADCQERENPHAQQLADELTAEFEALELEVAVTVDDIMGWFCQGYGFGEIEHAYRLSLATNSEDYKLLDLDAEPLDVEAIMAMREAGMGWGEIKQELGLQTPNGKLPNEKSNNGQGPNGDTTGDTDDTSDDTPTDVPDAPGKSPSEKGNRNNRSNAPGQSQKDTGQTNKPENNPGAANSGSGNSPPGQDKAKNKG